MIKKISRWFTSLNFGIYISFVAALIALSSLLFLYGYQQSIKYAAIVAKSSEIRESVQTMNTHVNIADMGLRGYIIIKDDKFLVPFNEAYNKYQANLDSLGLQLEAQQYPQFHQLSEVREVLTVYMNLLHELVELRRQERLDELLEILEKDPGYDTWKVYSKFNNEVLTFVQQAENEAKQKYEFIFLLIIWIQSLLACFGLPILVMVIIKLSRTLRSRKQLFEELHSSNKQYIFDPVNEEQDADEQAIIRNITANLKQASDFIKSITSGDYSVKWQGMNEQNLHANQENIAGELIQMREQMKKVKEADQRRLWATEGLSKVAEITRKYQHDIQQLADALLINVVKYLEANQAGLFVISGQEEEDKHLELVACYAYERKKHLKKQLEIGEGLLGQAYLEADTIYITDLPENYINITSGLGKGVPRSILIVPLKFNEEVMGVIELASFQPMADYQISFVEDVAEIIASSLSTVSINAKTKNLLEQSQEQAEMMRAQEEEMRQNMEELQATQEEIERKTGELSRFTSAIDRASVIVDFDSNGRIIHVNQKFCEVTGYSKDEALGQLHSFYVAKDEIQSGAFEKLWESLRSQHYHEKVVKRVRKNGSFLWLRAYYFPIRNEAGDLVRINCICSDISKEMEHQIEMEKQLNDLKTQLAK